MRLTFARVKNYKSHRETREIQLAKGFTVIVGQNNSGKTALLEALNPRTFQNVPHRMPQRGEYPPVPNPLSEIDIGIAISGKELDFGLLSAGLNLWLPVPEGLDRANRHIFASKLLSNPNLNFVLHRHPGANWTSEFPSHRLFQVTATGNRYSTRIDARADRQGWVLGDDSGGNDDLPNFVGGILSRSYYGFRAERLSVARCGINDSNELQPDASNLASVLLQLPKNRKAHDLFQQYVREIFPSIFWIGSRPINSGTAEIEIAMSDSDTGEAGIIVSLSECGTGVGQILALLYVVVTSTFPRIIAIDEPNSFLHPGAAKKLISILRKFDHQYIISTHSAELIKIANPEYIHLVEWQKTESTIRTLDRESIDDQRKLLSDLGVSLSDVFGADQILWVEGPTEERSLPLILQYLNLASPTLLIASLIATDDLGGNRPRARLAWDVYEKLSTGNALVPPALAFILDQEDRSEREKEDLVRSSRGKVRFLPRRTYENYLIEPSAINAVISKLMGGTELPQSANEWIESHKGDRKYSERSSSKDATWEVEVNAPRLLYDLFNTLSDAKLEYRKTTHSVLLTEWLLTNRPDHLTELFDFIRSLMPSSR